MQVKRDQLGMSGSTEFVERNPSFTYHATVNYENLSFDPSDGKVDGGIELLTAVNVPLMGQPTCVSGSAANNFRVTRNAFGNNSLSFNNDTNINCSPVTTFLHAGAELFRFDEFGGADMAIYQSSTGKWLIQDEFQEVTTLPELSYNGLSDALAPADYDGDGITDPAVWYGTGEFFYRMSSNYYKTSPSFWRPKSFDEKAVPSDYDYDGDRVSDIALWRPDGKWIIRRSSDLVDMEIQWGNGSLGDIPVPGDYDGDGKTDAAIWRASTGQWWVLRSSDGSHVVTQWGDGW